ncbi:MAG: hypothetical protein DHS20C02_01280 [Micavibrio sp.]|nr:MAG: hypothetical protein DHS20C02_01280 [Micavibrio sp.]
MSHSKRPQNNPYADAAGAYDQNAQAHTPDQRELEGRVLLKAAKMIQDLQEGWDGINGEIIEETLKYNRQIWMMFYDTALENPEGDRPNDLRSNIINLANFIFKREVDIMADPKKEKLDVLININREIAAGLMTKQDAGPEDKKADP